MKCEAQYRALRPDSAARIDAVRRVCSPLWVRLTAVADQHGLKVALGAQSCEGGAPVECLGARPSAATASVSAHHPRYAANTRSSRESSAGVPSTAIRPRSIT